jgi:two-component system, NarL family, invasion response regulator UvrY
MSKRSNPIKLFIADDHPAISLAVTHGLKAKAMEIVGRTLAPDEVMDSVQRLQPDVVVLDVRFGRETANTGLDVARKVRNAFADVGIVVYSQFDNVEIVQEAYRAGAQAFVPKSAPLEMLAQAIEQAHAKRIYLTPEIAQLLAMVKISGDRSPQAVLEERELEVFRYIAIGLTSNEIAEEMGMSPKTISNVRQAALEKLKVERPADITLLAVEHGLISPVPFTHAR